MMTQTTNIRYFILTLIICLGFVPNMLLAAESDQTIVKPSDGPLRLPDGYKKSDQEKRCMTICKRWGKECIVAGGSGSIAVDGQGNVSGSGGGSRKCRRVCKSFGEECF